MKESEKFMYAALKQAAKAASADEVPIGAVVVKNGKILSRAYNTRNLSANATDHAELKAISSACKKLSDWRLNGCDLYVTLEPCVMCLGACFNARLSNVYFGAYDASGNGCIPIAQMLERTLNHTIILEGGVLGKQCSQMLSEYFSSKRQPSDN